MFSQDLELKLKSSGPARRAGLDLSPVGQWAVHALVVAGIDGLKRLLALVEDPKIDVKLRPAGSEDDDGWHVPSIEEIRELIAEVSPPVLVVDTGAVEAALREMVEAYILAIREGRCPLPPIDEIRETTAQIRAAKPSDFGQGLMIDPDQAELDLTGAWIKDLGDEGKVLNADVVLPGDAGEPDTRGQVSPPTEGEEKPNTVAPEALPSDAGQNAGTDTSESASHSGESAGQVQEAVDPSATAPVPPVTPAAANETAAKPAKAKRQTKPEA